MKLKQRAIALSLFLVLVVISTIFLKIYPKLIFPQRSTRSSVPATSASTSAMRSSLSSPLHLPLEKNRTRSSPSSTKLVGTGSLEKTWWLWRSWVQEEAFYPEEVFSSGQMRHLLQAMTSAPIIEFDVGRRGTQLKASVLLEGRQKALFKPRRYSRDYIVTGEPYAGFDRHNGEIAGFFLDSLLGFRLAPPVVGRKLNLTHLLPVTSPRLLKTYFKEEGNTCFYGECYYCKKAEAACGEGDIMEGSLTIWLPDWYMLRTRNHPYQRTYRDGVKARWEVDNDYCLKMMRQKMSPYYHGLLEFTDTAIYDYLMGNADRHHYETYSRAVPHGKLLHIDNGKTFGNPHYDEPSILAPISQCCKVRRSTYQRLKDLQMPPRGPLSVAMDTLLQTDPLYPLLTPHHLQALDRRHAGLLATIQHCINKHSESAVLLEHWP